MDSAQNLLAPQTAPESAPFLVEDLCRMLSSYLEQEQVAEVYRAYLFSARAHEGQQRVSGEPYISHPLATAKG